MIRGKGGILQILTEVRAAKVLVYCLIFSG